MAMRRTGVLLASAPRRLRVRSIGGSPDRPAARPGEDEYNAMYGAGWDSGAAQVRVGVWWDFENCNVPFGIDAHRVGINIVSGLRSSGFKGPVSISGYGDMLQLSRTVQESLTATGIRLHHVPSGGRESESSDRALLMDLMLWTIDNPPPAHLFLISGDRDFSTALHKLRMRNYNVLLACPAGNMISPALLGAASRVWYWNSLVRGEGLVAATSWSSDGPPPKPIIPPLKSASASPPPKVEQDVTGLRSNQEKIPYFTSQPSTSVQEMANLKTNQEKIYSSRPAPCPPVPPPFSSPSTSTPPLGTGKASYVSPYSVSSPLFPSVSTVSSPHPRVSPKTEHYQVSTSKSEAALTKTNSGATTSVDNKRNAVHDKVNNKTDCIQDVLGRLDALLKAHPQGLWMSELQGHMVSRKIQFDSDFFGHKKLVPYLLTLPRIARVERHLMRDNKTWSYMFFSSSAPPSDMKSSKRAGYPRDIVCQLGDLFRHHPKGLWLGDFNAQLVARSIRLDSHFYGHVKLVPFLLTLPELVKIERRYIGDRWNYIFIWNQLQCLKPEHYVEKPQLVVRRLDKPEDRKVERSTVVPEREENSFQQHQGTDSPTGRISGDSATALATREPEHALVLVEDHVTVFSRIVASSESIFELLKNVYQRLWPKEDSERSLGGLKELDVNREAKWDSASEVEVLKLTSVDNSETSLKAGHSTKEQETRSGAMQKPGEKAKLKRRPVKRNSGLRAHIFSTDATLDVQRGWPENNKAIGVTEEAGPETSQTFNGASTKMEEKATNTEFKKEQEHLAQEAEETSIDADRVLKLFECIEVSRDDPTSVLEKSLVSSSSSEHEIQKTRSEAIASATEPLKLLMVLEPDSSSRLSDPCMESMEKAKRSCKKKAGKQSTDNMEAMPLKTKRKSKRSSEDVISVNISQVEDVSIVPIVVEAADSAGTVTSRTSKKKRGAVGETLSITNKMTPKDGSLAESSAKKKTRKSDKSIPSSKLTPNEEPDDLIGTLKETSCDKSNAEKRKPRSKKQR